MTPPPRPRALLFDWDNTLADNWGAIHAALNATFAAMGHPPWTLAETRQRVRQSLRDSFPRMFGERWQAAKDVFYGAIEATHLETLRPLAGADSTLRALAASGAVLGVVSNKRGTLLRREAERLGWSGYFHRVVGAGDAPADKPAPDPVLLALAGSGVSPGPDVWFVGDAAIDMDCARRAGVSGVLVGPAAGEEAQIAALAPAGRVGDLVELLSLVESAGWSISRTQS
jgi:phosphoglycolate phosphatase